MLTGTGAEGELDVVEVVRCFEVVGAVAVEGDVIECDGEWVDDAAGVVAGHGGFVGRVVDELVDVGEGDVVEVGIESCTGSEV